MGGGDAPSGLAEQPASIVLVDDDAFSVSFFRDMLSRGGHRVREFESAAESLLSMEKDPPDVLITDWFMPGTTGPELIRKIRKIPALVGTYCILLTAFDREGQKVAGLERGADDYLTKSVTEPELLARIRVGVRVRRLERTAALLAMAATLGHEINNPLTAVVGYLHLCEAEIEAGSKEGVLRHLKKVQESAERIRVVVRRLMELSDARLTQYQTGTMMLDLGAKAPPPGPPPVPPVPPPA